MSYCRICDDSDVYVLCSRAYEITLSCVGGPLYFVRESPKEVLSVLEVISKLGYKVPERAINRLKGEL